MERIIGGKYKLGRKIGGGSFGEIFLGDCSRPFCFSTFFSLLWSEIDSYRLVVLFVVFAATHVDTFEIVAVKIVSFSSSAMRRIRSGDLI